MSVVAKPVAQLALLSIFCAGGTPSTILGTQRIHKVYRKKNKNWVYWETSNCFNWATGLSTTIVVLCINSSIATSSSWWRSRFPPWLWSLFHKLHKIWELCAWLWGNQISSLVALKALAQLSQSTQVQLPSFCFGRGTVNHGGNSENPPGFLEKEKLGTLGNRFEYYYCNP